MHQLRSLLPDSHITRLLAASALLGVFVRITVSLFEFITIEVGLDWLLEQPSYIQAGAPMLGLGIASLILYGAKTNSATSDEYITAYHSRTPHLPIRVWPARMFAGVATIAGGGAMGLEGPSIYTGSVAGLALNKRIKGWLGRDSAKLLLTAGAAAGVSAVFQAPATGVIFALEAPYRDDLAAKAILPALIASASSYLTSSWVPFGGTTTLLPLAFDAEIEPSRLVGAILIGLGAGFGGRVYSWSIRVAKGLAEEHHTFKRVIASGAALAGLVFMSFALFNEGLTLGPGINVVNWIADESPVAWMLMLMFGMRMLATFLTVTAGGTGGFFIPLAVQGVILGNLVGTLLESTGIGANDSLWPILGLAAFLAAGYRTPIAAVMFVAERTGGGAAVVPALIAAAFSQLVAGKSSVAKGQHAERLGHLEGRLQLPLSAALTTDTLTVPPDATVSEFVWIHAVGRREPVVPVVEGGKYLGMCSLEAATGIERDQWDTTTVAQIVNDNAPVALPSWSLRDAVAAMDSAGLEQLAVTTNDGAFVGIVLESEIVKLEEILAETGGDTLA